MENTEYEFPGQNPAVSSILTRSTNPAQFNHLKRNFKIKCIEQSLLPWIFDPKAMSPPIVAAPCPQCVREPDIERNLVGFPLLESSQLQISSMIQELSCSLKR